MSFKIFLDSATNPGIRRRGKPNQDYVDFKEPKDQVQLTGSGYIFVVADGVGGASAGHRASEFAVKEVIARYYREEGKTPGDRLRRTVRQVGDRLHQLANKSNSRMATTLVAVVVIGNKLTVANVGDSRAYLLHNGNLEQMTQDHNIAGEMTRDGLTEDEALRSKMKNKLTRSIGGERDVHVDIFERELTVGDRVFLCTDGITRYATKQDIHRIVSQEDGSKIVADAIAFANKPVHTFKDGRKVRGGADNITALVFQIGAETSEIGVSPFKPMIENDDAEATLVLDGGRIAKKRKSKLGVAPILVLAVVGVVASLFLFVPGFGAGLLANESNSMLENTISVRLTGTSIATADLVPEIIVPSATGTEEIVAATGTIQSTNEVTQPELLTPIAPIDIENTMICLEKITDWYANNPNGSLDGVVRKYFSSFDWEEHNPYTIFRGCNESEGKLSCRQVKLDVTADKVIVQPGDLVPVYGLTEDACKGDWVLYPEIEE